MDIPKFVDCNHVIEFIKKVKNECVTKEEMYDAYQKIKEQVKIDTSISITDKTKLLDILEQETEL